MDESRLWMVTMYNAQGLRVGIEVSGDLEGILNRAKGWRKLNKGGMWKLWECHDVVAKIAGEVIEKEG